MQQTTAYIGLGSNLGDGLTTLKNAWRDLGERDNIETVALSHPYLSAPVDMQSSNWFTNAVGMLKTGRASLALLDCLKAIESSFGRRRSEGATGYQDRSLDLDIIYFGDMVIDSDRLTLPHPFLAQRLFVLEPLAEIAPELVDPVDGMMVIAKKNILHRRMDTGDIDVQQITKAQW